MNADPMCPAKDAHDNRVTAGIHGYTYAFGAPVSKRRLHVSDAFDSRLSPYGTGR